MSIAETALVQGLQLVIQQQAEALEKAGQDAGWHNIETAPKDGTRVLLWGFDGYSQVIGFWNSYHNPAHWCFSQETVVRNANIPTHWMQLPDPPIDAAIKGDNHHG